MTIYVAVNSRPFDDITITVSSSDKSEGIIAMIDGKVVNSDAATITFPFTLVSVRKSPIFQKCQISTLLLGGVSPTPIWVLN